jgi:hypothetical protein
MPAEKGEAMQESEARRVRAHRPIFSRVLFPVTGLLALFWWTVRVLPKPSRATYPCQRVTLPVASGFLLWLLGTLVSLEALRRIRARFSSHRRLLLLAGLGLLLGVVLFAGLPSLPASAWTPSDPPNQPMGTARGTYPGRVVWFRNPQATLWNGTSGNWWSDANTSQTAVDDMLSRSLQALTGTGADAAAWDALFRYFNQTHGQGDRGYASGERIAIKINLNNNGGYGDADNGVDASPQAVLALLRQLVNGAAVPPAMITVYDAIRPMPDRIYTKGHTEFPNVVWADSVGTNGRVKVQWKSSVTYSKPNGCGTTIPSFLVDSTNYLINMPLLKGHEYAGVTLTAKNHYGSLQTREHDLIYAHNYPMGNYSHLVDLMGHKNLDGKAMLFIVDGLYATCINTDSVNSTTAGWKNLFGGGWAASLLVSQDPVAIDSVGFDFLNAEFSGGSDARFNTAIVHADNYLHEAAQADHPPSGTLYAPNGDGVRLSSLGAHEHWNNPTNKQYSRNLGTGSGIELIQLPQTSGSGGSGGSAGATGGHAGTTSAGGSMSTPDASGLSGADAGTPAEGGETDCGCRVARSDPRLAGVWLGALASWLLLRGRRKLGRAIPASARRNSSRGFPGNA